MGVRAAFGAGNLALSPEKKGKSGGLLLPERERERDFVVVVAACHPFS